MRISDHRYSRDRSRLDIALQFIQHEARTRTIRLWTGLSDDRIRKLYRSYLREPLSAPPIRHRGKSPRQAAFFMRSHRVREQSALLASLCCLVGVLPEKPTPELAKSLPSLGRAELLCQAYSIYRALRADPLISFEHTVFLLGALVRGDELVLSACPDCGAVLIVDRWSVRAPRCVACSDEPAPTVATSSLAGPPHGLQDLSPDDAGAELKSGRPDL